MNRSETDERNDITPDKPTLEGVTICTWGSSVAANSGIPKLINDTFHGENVGHAAIMLSLKNNDQNLKMVKKYCDKTRIPYSFREVKTKSVSYVKDDEESEHLQKGNQTKTIGTEGAEFEAYKSKLQSMGKLIVTDESGQRIVVRQVIDDAKPAYQEKLINVYFSWWPGINEKGYNLVSDMFTDNTLERKGVPVSYSKIAEEMQLEPEHRLLSGFLQTLSLGMINAKEVSLGPKSIEHTASLPQDIVSMLSLRHEIDNLIEQHESCRTLFDKLYTIQENSTPLSKSTLLSLKNLLGAELHNYVSDQDTAIKNLKGLKIRIAIESDNIYKQFRTMSRIYLNDLEKLNTGTDAKYKGFAAIYQIKQNRYLEYNDNDGAIRKAFRQYLDNHAKDFPMEGAQFIDAFLNNLKELNIKHSEVFLRTIFQGLANNTEQVDKKNLEEAYKNGLKRYWDNDVSLYRIENYTKIRNEMEKPVLREYLNLALSTGHPPDNIVEIPLDPSGNRGISPERLLEAMSEFVSAPENRFNITNNNCSVAVSVVLEKSTGDLGEKIFGKREFSGVATPQLVHTNAVNYLETLQNPEHTLRILEESGYIQARNYVVATALDGISKLSDKESGTLQRVGGALKTLATVPALVLLGLKEAIVSSESNYTTTEASEIEPVPLKDTTSRLIDQLGGKGNMEHRTDQQTAEPLEMSVDSDDKKVLQKSNELVETVDQEELVQDQPLKPR
jgi:hypothetical protein